MTLDELFATFQRWLHLPDPTPLYAVLGTVAANYMAGDPVWLMLVGSPSSGKSEILQGLSGLPGVFPTGTLNEPGLLSGTSKKDTDPDATGGLLREIGDFGFIVCKDFTSILSMNSEKLRSLLAALREIYDGSWTLRLGGGGGKSFSWRGKVGLLAGCTHAIENSHPLTSTMGERFVQLMMPRLSDEEEQAQTRRALDRRHQEEEMRDELRRAVAEFVASWELPSEPAPLSDAEIVKLDALAMFVARARSAVDRHAFQRDIQFVPPPEISTRLFLSLKGQFSGMLVIGVPRASAWDTIVKVGFDSIPSLRRSILNLFIGGRELLNIQAIAAHTGCSPTAVRRNLEELQAHGLMGCELGGGPVASRWGLTEWAWAKYELAVSRVPETAEDSTHRSRDLGTPPPAASVPETSAPHGDELSRSVEEGRECSFSENSTEE